MIMTGVSLHKKYGLLLAQITPDDIIGLHFIGST